MASNGEKIGSLFALGAMLGKAVYDDSQIKKNNNTEEFQEELRNNIEELDELSDVELLVEFHKEYDDHYGEGLFILDVGNAMDPLYKAYMEVFKKRNIERTEVRCRECDKLLGYRMIPRDFNIIKGNYNMTHGYCECRCGGSERWEICGGCGNKPYIRVYEY